MATDTRSGPTSRARAALRRRSFATAGASDSLMAGMLVVAFIAITAWWLARDRRVPDFDTGNHLFNAFVAHDEIARGDLLGPLRDWTNYPPLGHVVGALGTLVGGVGEWQAIAAQNLVFVPLLALGCFGIGRLAYGSRAGLLAVAFAIGTPELISQFHSFLLDAPEAAMVALCAWAILASDRFRRPGVAAAAGVAFGLGTLSKQTFVIFVAGLLVVVIVRGGWRNRRGLLIFAVLAAAFSLPWYLYHYGQLHDLTSGAVATASAAVAQSQSHAAVPVDPLRPSRFSRRNAGWYFWNLVNIQLLVPLALLFLIGAVVLAVRYARRPSKADLTPELAMGGLVSYLGMTYVTLKDPRYTLPALVYMACFGTGWIVSLGPRFRRLMTLVVVVVAMVNTAAVSFGVGRPEAISLAGASNGFTRSFTFYSPAGYVRGGPAKDGDVLNLMRSLRRSGVRQIGIDGGSANALDFNFAGLRAFSRIADLPIVAGDNLSALRPQDGFLLRRSPQEGDPRPCQRLSDGSGIYVELGNPLRFPFELGTFICPGRRPERYRRTAPLPATITHVVAGPARASLLRLMRGLRRAGTRVVEFDPVSMVSESTDLIGLTKLVVIAGLRRPPTYAPSKLGPHDAFLIGHPPIAGVAPCVTLPGGPGVYVVLGNPVIPFAQYRFYCPLRRPAFQRASG